jgi:hypothetical protein
MVPGVSGPEELAAVALRGLKVPSFSPTFHSACMRGTLLTPSDDSAVLSPVRIESNP